MLDFIELFNGVARVARPALENGAGASAMQDRLTEVGIDSLDVMVLLMYMCELYGIDEATSKEWRAETVSDVHDLLMAHKTREPASVASALEQIK
ncbi:MAG TPA: hypothetical protein VF816_16790 [Rhodocyclaceae bacterium]